MSILTRHPESVMRSIQDLPDTNQFIVVNEETGITQYFAQFSYHTEESLGKFVDARDHLSPASIYDYDTAIYLIGQSAIYHTLADEKMERYRLVPILGRAISSPINQSK